MFLFIYLFFTSKIIEFKLFSATCYYLTGSREIILSFYAQLAFYVIAFHSDF